MEAVLSSAGQGWRVADHRIRSWYHQRSKLLEQAQHLNLLLSFPDEASPEDSVAGAMSGLCQQLIDYVSAGHFTVYEHLVRPSRPTGSPALCKLYRSIEQTTDAILDFNASLEDAHRQQHAPDLGSRLDHLISQLTMRFMLEDTLVSVVETHDMPLDTVVVAS